MYFILRLMARKHETIYWLVGGLKSKEEYSTGSLLNDMFKPLFYTQPWSFTINK